MNTNKTSRGFAPIQTMLLGFCLAAILFAWGHMPSVAYASLQNINPQSINYVPLAPIDVEGSEIRPGTGATAECRAPTCFPRYLRTIYNVGIALAGLFAVVSIVRGGFQLMFTDSILGRSEGKGIILRALGGLVIVYSSYILMNLINPALGRDLDLALQFPHIPKVDDPTPLTIVGLTPEERYSQSLDALLADLDAENAKPNVIDAKEAQRKIFDADEAIRKLNEEINDPTKTAEQIRALIEKRDALLAARTTLLGKTIDANVVAAKARINLQTENYKYQMDQNGSVEGINRIYAEGFTALIQKGDAEIRAINQRGSPEKIQEVRATVIDALKSLCAEQNRLVSSSFRSDCSKIDNIAI